MRWSWQACHCQTRRYAHCSSIRPTFFFMPRIVSTLIRSSLRFSCFVFRLLCSAKSGQCCLAVVWHIDVGQYLDRFENLGIHLFWSLPLRLVIDDGADALYFETAIITASVVSCWCTASWFVIGFGSASISASSSSIWGGSWRFSIYNLLDVTFLLVV